MARRVRRVVLVLVVLLVGVAVAVVLVGRTKLDDARADVDNAWKPLRAPLAVRYLRLAALGSAFHDVAGDRTVTRDLDRLLRRWGNEQNAKDPDPADEVATANALEGAARRVIAANGAAPRLQANEQLQTAITEFQSFEVPPKVVATYEREARDYQDQLDATLWSPAARIFGYDTRPVLTLAT